MGYKTRTAQQDATCGLVMGDERHPGSRIWYDCMFGQAVAKSSSIKGTSGTNVVGSWNQHFVRSGEGTMLAVARSGGCTRLTAESSDSASGCIVKPRVNSVFTTVKWNTGDEVIFDCLLKTGSGTITTTAIQAGLMLTGAMNKTTDADQVKFFYNAGSTSLLICYSGAGISGTPDMEINTGVTLAASTLYHLVLAFGSDRTVKGYVNGAHVGTTEALDASTALVPIMGVASDGSAADPFIDLYRITLSKNAA